MKLTIKGKMKLSEYENYLLIPVDREIAEPLVLEQDGAKYPYVCEIKQKRPKRSLNANSYFWLLVGEIAEALRLDNQSIYETMLQRYSKAYTYMVVKPEAVQQIKATLREGHIYAYEIGNVDVNDKEGVQLQLYYGSSTFDSKSMSRLIDGIVGEAKELNIETATPNEIAKLKQDWKGYSQHAIAE
jgi:hypothetical protein